MAASVITGLFLFFCLLQSASAERQITAHPGDDVTLPCRAPYNAIITAVEWVRSNLDPDRYVYLKEGGRLNTADQDPSYVNRVQLNDDVMRNGELSLILKNVNSNDEGTYECRYEERGGWKRGDQIKLVVIRDAGELQRIRITAYRGGTVTLPGRAPVGVPVKAVKWTRTDLQQYVFLKREEYLDPTHQHPSYVNRVWLKEDAMMKNGELSDSEEREQQRYRKIHVFLYEDRRLR
ncbi:uncharacterized protein LOC128384142 [Scomber japonicus]|uniref:uncharacterized protein LOC128384142 n=1 Tax=Scomber japonicus TaxID=13676 RepID=UPI0023055133|nr:uncharacterized protein LOC128384142 [Scomber japonicus]